MCYVWRSSRAGRWHTDTFQQSLQYSTTGLAITFCFCLKRLQSNLSAFTKSRNFALAEQYFDWLSLSPQQEFSYYVSPTPAVERTTGRALASPKHHWASLPREGSLPWFQAATGSIPLCQAPSSCAPWQGTTHCLICNTWSKALLSQPEVQSL